MPFTSSQKRGFGIIDLSQYTMGGTSNVPLDKASFEAIIILKIIQQFRELTEEVIDN